MSAGEDTIALRPATMDDREMVFRWRNDPFILGHGSSQREVQWEEHKQWFENTIFGESRKTFIVLNQGDPIGQVRFDRQDEQTAVVSVYLLQAFTGRGLGVQAIRMGCDAIFESWVIDRIVACVREDNLASRSAFLKAGFQEANATGACPSKHFSLILAKIAPGNHLISA